MKKSIILFLVAFISFSSLAQTTIIGNWKLVKMSYANRYNKSIYTVYESGKTDSNKKILLQFYIEQANSDTGLVKIDTAAFKAKLEKDFKTYDSVNMRIKKDGTFLINSFDLIIPADEPGWHFGNKISGKWLKNNMHLKLTIGDKKTQNLFFYKILSLTKNRLIIEETSEDNVERFNQIIFNRK